MMKKVLLALVVSVLFGTTNVYAQEYCGHESLRAVLHQLGVEKSLSEVLSIVGYEAQNSIKGGTNLLQLKRGAEKFGMHALAVKISLKELKATHVFAIIQTGGNHFAAITTKSSTTKQLFCDDKTFADKEWPDQSLAYHWRTGKALLVSHDPIVLAQIKNDGPDIRYDKLEYDFGTVKVGDKIKTFFEVKNAGNKELGVWVTPGTSTRFLTISPDILTIPPGKSDKFTVIVDTSDKQDNDSVSMRGELASSFVVETNDPIERSTTFLLYGKAMTDKLRYFPETVDWGVISDDLPREERILISDTDIRDVEIRNTNLAPGSSLTAQIENHYKKEKAGAAVVLRFDPTKVKTKGEFKQTVEVFTNHPKYPKLTVVVKALVK